MNFELFYVLDCDHTIDEAVGRKREHKYYPLCCVCYAITRKQDKR